MNFAAQPQNILYSIKNAGERFVPFIKKGSMMTQLPFLVVCLDRLELNPFFNFFHIGAELLVCFNQVVYGTAGVQHRCMIFVAAV